MIEKIIYLILVIVLGYLYFKVDSKLWSNHYNSHTKSSFLFVSKFPVAIFYPKPFFKKINFWRGYLLYLFMWVLAGLSLYFLLKLVGIL